MPAPPRSPRLVYVVTDPITAYYFLDGQLRFMRERGFDVTVISSPGELLDAAAEREGVRAIAVPMRRGMAPVEDVPSLVRLVRELRRLSPDLVVAGTPKAGLLGTMAARLARVPHVIYHLRGLRFETATGSKRRILLATERLAAACAESVQCNGESLRRGFVAAGCAPSQKTWVPGAGTSNGVDAKKFEATPERRQWAREERKRLGIDEGDFIVGYVGRLATDKGVAELVEAFRRLSRQAPQARLLMLGDHEATDPLPPDVRDRLEATSGLIRLGHVRDPAPYYTLMNVLAFPSHREGFPNVPLEAASAALPVIGFSATGTVDAVVDGETGTLVPVGDAAALAVALGHYAADPELCRRHGEAGRQRVLALFDQQRLWGTLADEYERRMGLSAPRPVG